MLRKRTLLHFESLESKRLLACDVAYDGETLEIKCDDQGDLILVNGILGDLYVNGENRGSAENLTDIKIKSKGGADSIIMTNLDVAGSIELKTGGGAVADDDIDDVIALTNVTVGGDLNIKMGQGADSVFVQGGVNVQDSVVVKMGRGHDTVFASFGLLTADEIDLDGKVGDDTITGVDNLFALSELKIKDFEDIS